MAGTADLARIRVDDVDEAQPLGRYLILLFRAFEIEVLEALRAGGYTDLTEADLDILRFISPEGSRAVDVARLAGITKQGAGKAVHDLERRGYLKRRNHREDSRAKLIAFTPKGRIVIGKAIEVIGGIERRYARLLGARHVQELKRSLRLLLDDHRQRKATS
jgi:DNA-binding MarR family transcriptional regulator